jgi:hypothetical protein
MYPRIPQSLSTRPNWDPPPTPSSASECVPPQETKGVWGHILACMRVRWWGDLNSDDLRENHSVYSVVLAIIGCVYS